MIKYFPFQCQLNGKYSFIRNLLALSQSLNLSRLDIISKTNRRKGLLLVLTAALLLELLSGAQYLYTHHLMEEQLENYAECELTMKAVMTNGTLRAAESVLENYQLYFGEYVGHPDSVFASVSKMVGIGTYLKGGSIRFSRYTDHDTCDMASAHYGAWTEPYVSNDSAKSPVTSFSLQINDKSDHHVGVACADVSLTWLSDTLELRHFYPSSFLLMLTDKGNIFVRPSAEKVSPAVINTVINLVRDTTIARYTSNSGLSTVVPFNIGKREGSVFYATMKHYRHLTIAVVCYDDEVYAPLQKMRITLLLLSLLAFGILLYMVASFVRGEKQLQQKSLEQERMNGELRIASKIQQSLLPADELTTDKTDGVIVEGRLIPAKAVGGDLYDYFVRDNKLFFCIGDVSGKGISSALIMTVTQTLFRDVAMRNTEPALIMNSLNESVCRNNKSNMFVTMFIGVLDLPTGHLRYCNAGHDLPMLLKPGNCHPLEVFHSLPIGIFPDFTYNSQETVMHFGETLFLCTDGLTEARNEARQFLGHERVANVLADSCDKDAKSLVDTVIDSWERYVGNAEQSDDLTLLAVTYKR